MRNTPRRILRRSSNNCCVFCTTSCLSAGEEIIFSMISSWRAMISSSSGLYPELLLRAKSAASRRRSVTPFSAETTTITGSCSFSTMLFTNCRLSGLPTEVPPNFITFIVYEYFLPSCGRCVIRNVNCRSQTGRFAKGKQRCRADVKIYITPQGVMVIVVVKYVEYNFCISNICDVNLMQR